MILARIQFGITIGFHFLFPAMTLGLIFFILIYETLYLVKKDDGYKTISGFLIKLLALIFVMGVATGITMEFSFGTNWAQYSRAVGNIFGPMLAMEGVFAFFLESVFLAIMVFGREKVSKQLYYISVLMVFIGSHLSALFILAANSWMQTPAGYKIENGKIMLANFSEAFFNHSTLIRLEHTVIAAWLTGTVLVSGIAAWYILKSRYTDTAKKMLKAAIIVFTFLPLLQLVSGHNQAVNVAKLQPAKDAAIEGIFKTGRFQPLYAMAIPDAKNKRLLFAIGAPGMLSFLENWDVNSEVKGLDAFPESEWPPVNTVFTTFHLMVAIGMLLIAAGLLGGFLLWRKMLFTSKWYLIALPFLIPFPHAANELGWVSAEMGRQPWIIYGLMKTSAAASVSVPAGQVLFSLILFSLIYLLLLVVFIKTAVGFVNKGFETK